MTDTSIRIICGLVGMVGLLQAIRTNDWSLHSVRLILFFSIVAAVPEMGPAPRRLYLSIVVGTVFIVLHILDSLGYFSKD